MKKFEDYLEAISRLNNLGNGFNVQWLFYNGMLFSSYAKWWGDWKIRSTRHEGIDICWYRIPGQMDTLCFDPQIKIPAMDKGRILNICNDFLGQTIAIEFSGTASPSQNAFPVIYTYAHIIPEKELKIGTEIEKGEVIARVCPTHKNPQLPPHLHFSCFELCSSLQNEKLDWNLFTDESHVNMIHPFFL